MRKITLLIIIASLPFFTVAQKRGKKKEKSAISLLSDNSEFMIVVGVENVSNLNPRTPKKTGGIQSSSPQKLVQSFGKSSKIKLLYDFGNSEGEKDLSKFFPGVKTIADAINSLSEYGWKFHSSNIVYDGRSVRKHYYYLTK